jgi:ABC-type branched-subunit amino acid transport system substrate-binding protein
VIVIAVLSTVTLGKPETFTVGDTPSAENQANAVNRAPNQEVPQGPGTSGASAIGGPGTAGEANGNSGGTHAPTKTTTTACSQGHNGGSTDTGVNGKQIKLAATVVKSGVGAAFLGDVEFGMLAVMNHQNRQGGICGRQLSLTLNDDAWSASQGQQDIDKYIQEGYFALAVVPSSEGLNQAVNAHDIDRAGIPVVGTDGMIASQYTDPWVWPVATSTISFMHIMTKNAHSRGARTFAIVYDNQYRFGVEGDSAFKGAISRLSGASIPDGCDYPVQAGQTTYGNDVSTFNGACDKVDFVALLLEPETAAQWIKDGGYLGTAGKAIGAGGPQTLFTYDFGKDFAANCQGDQCKANFWVWTGFNPPVPPDDSIPQVQAYVNDLNATNSSADHDNQFVEGGYLGMELLVQAMKKVGPNLTRAGLRQALDSMTLDSGLTGSPETFRPGHHFANVSAQAFSLLASTGSFSGFRYQQTGFIADPWVGDDVPS